MTLNLLKLAKQNDGESSKLRIAVIDALKTIHDPEIPINIYDLGLIYKLEIDENGKVNIDLSHYCRKPGQGRAGREQRACRNRLGAPLGKESHDRARSHRAGIVLT
jgi:hypothetical protein